MDFKRRLSIFIDAQHEEIFGRTLSMHRIFLAHTQHV
jgi:hypothetical protein